MLFISLRILTIAIVVAGFASSMASAESFILSSIDYSVCTGPITKGSPCPHSIDEDPRINENHLINGIPPSDAKITISGEPRLTVISRPTISGGQGPKLTASSGSLTGGIISGRVAQTVGGIVGGARGGSGGVFASGGSSGGEPSIPSGSLGTSDNNKSQKIASSDKKSITGMSAGSVPAEIGVWGNGGQTWLGGNQANNDYYGVIRTTMFGADVTIDSKYVLGLSAGIGHEKTKIGYSGTNVTGKVITIAPYAAWIIDDTFYFDASGGASRVFYHQERSTYDDRNNGLRWFAGSNLNAAKTLGDWSLGTNIGYLYSAERQNSYTSNSGTVVPESKSRTGQVRSTSRVGYNWQTSWGRVSPYGSVRLEYDANKTGATILSDGNMAANSLFGTTFGVGTDIGVGSNSTVTIEGTTTEFREHTSIYGLTANARVIF